MEQELKETVKQSPTIQDVARVANVSTATVSRALSSPGRVAEETRRLVIEAVQETGYQVNLTARNLRCGVQRTARECDEREAPGDDGRSLQDDGQGTGLGFPDHLGAPDESDDGNGREKLGPAYEVDLQR